MFERAYQGAPSLEILNPQGVNPIGLWKVVGSVQRVFDKALRGHVYQLMSNGAQTMLQLPKEDKSKQGLGLVQPCLVLQVFLPQNRDKPFALEVGVTDNSRSKRRLLFSAAAQEAHAAGCPSGAMQVRLPLNGLRRGTWLNLCLDMDSLVRGSFGQVMKSLDSISVHAECRLRRIFTMRSLPQQSEIVGCVVEANGEGEYEQPAAQMPLASGMRLEPIPRSHEFPAGVDQHTQLLSGEQVGNSTEEMLKEERVYSNALPDAPHALQNDYNHDLGKTIEEESEDTGGVTTCRKDVSLEPLTLNRGDRMTNALAPLTASNHSSEPVSYEEMIRKAGEARDEKNHRAASDSHVAMAAVRQNNMVAETSGDRPEACMLPEAGRHRRTDKSAKSDTKARPVTRDALGTKGQNFQAACLGATAPRRKSNQRRPGDLSMQSRNASDPGCRRLPAAAKTLDRSPSNPPSNHRVRQARPLPLEIGAPRAVREDGATSAPCSGSSGCGAPPSSSRRGRRPGARLPVAQQSAGENESISPTPSAARRRRELAKQTLHKTAEIYGVHKHTPLLKGCDRGIEESRTLSLGARADEDDAEFLGLASPPGQSSLPEVAQTMRLLRSQNNSPQQARELQVEDADSPPGMSGSLEALPESNISTSDVSAVLQAAIALAPRELSIGQDHRRRPHGLEAEAYSRFEGADDGPNTPASSASMASPSRPLLGTRPDLADEIIHDEVFHSSSTLAGNHATVEAQSVILESARESVDPPADAWAFGTTVRHHHSCWPPLGARFRGALGHENGAWANGNGRENSSTHEVNPKDSGSSSLRSSDRSEASGSLTPYAPPQRRGLLGESSLEGDHRADVDRSSVEELRRIKSSSPPRQTFQRLRPHPISGLEDSFGQLASSDPSAPSSAPSDCPPRNLGDGCIGQCSEENRIQMQKLSCEVLLQQRPFTPPVVPVGKLLRGVYSTAKTATPGRELAAGAPSFGSSHHQGPPGVLETAVARSKCNDVEIKDRSTSFAAHGRLEETASRAVRHESAAEQVLEAIYDPVLDVYYDPVSNKYYERRRDTSDLHDEENHLTV